MQIDRIWEEEEGSDPLVKVWESAAQPLSSVLLLLLLPLPVRFN